MFVVGELNDKSMADRILDEYSMREIKGHYYFSSEHNSFVIAVEENDHLIIALDIYRVKLGLKKPVEIDPEWIKIKAVPRGQYTKSIVIFCVIIYLFSFFKIGEGIYKIFTIDSHETGFLIDVSKGQIWRILTPIFLHMGFFHVLFNMLWFYDLGSIIEYKYNKKFLIGFILLSGISSNLFQYLFMGSSFGGMSGVLYGLLAYLWILKKLDASFEFSLPKHDIILMIGWFFLCLFGIFPNVANYAHAGGIAVGIWIAVFYNNFKFSLDRMKYLSYGVFVVLITIIVEKYKWHF